MTRWRLLGYVALALGVAACARILGFRDEGPKRFEHRAHVIEGIACVRCHSGMEEAGDEGPLHLPSTEDCVACHEDPHDERTCSSCHGSPYTEIELRQTREHLRFDHSRHLADMPGQCVRCHQQVATPASKLRPDMPTCLECHEDDEVFERGECTTCHVDVPEDLTPPRSHMIHGEDFENTHGPMAASARDECASCHSERFCANCHGSAVPALPWRMNPADPMQESVHRAGFRARHSEESRLDPGTCSTCHTESWCRDCHIENDVAGASAGAIGSPHPPGWVGLGSNEHGPAARRDPASCAACHGGAGEMLCVSCHREGAIGGNPHPPGWSSDRDQREMPCRLCHPSTGGL